MTVEQFIANLDELVNAVRRRLGNREGLDLRATIGFCARRKAEVSRQGLSV